MHNDLFCCTSEIKTTLYVNYSPIKKKKKDSDSKKQPWKSNSSSDIRRPGHKIWGVVLP